MSDGRAEELAYWINERYAMKRRKDAQMLAKFGFSDDPIMGTTRWCNVHREDDKVTRWMRENWATKDSPVWWFVLGRMLNYIPTLEDIINKDIIYGDYDGDSQVRALPSLKVLADSLKARRESGEKVFTSAYTISTCGKSMDKIDYVVHYVCAAVKREEERGLPWEKLPTLHMVFDWLTLVDGLGSFLAGQVLADLKNTPGHPLQRAPDRATWACPGPGSLRGLTAFWSRPITSTNFAGALARCKEVTMPLVDKSIPPIDMQDWQNCMCEFGKYIKLKEGRGHARNRYYV